MRTIGVSIPIPEPYGSSLTAARHAAGDPLADAVPPHVTLLPPTRVERMSLDAFVTDLEKVAAQHPPFRMMLNGTGTFLPVSPVVFIAVAQGIGQCEALQSDVRGRTVERPLDFPYHPHVTIAHHVPEDNLEEAFDEMSDFRATFEVTAFDLYLQDDDGVWESVRRFALRG
ncbi:2'-5' RNA ligase family protein [Calidifontibacter terrae]